MVAMNVRLIVPADELEGKNAMNGSIEQVQRVNVNGHYVNQSLTDERNDAGAPIKKGSRA